LASDPAAVIRTSRQSGNVCAQAGFGTLVMIILAAIAAIWALSLLSLAFTLPLEFMSPPDNDNRAAEKSA